MQHHCIAVSEYHMVMVMVMAMVMVMVVVIIMAGKHKAEHRKGW